MPTRRFPALARWAALLGVLASVTAAGTAVSAAAQPQDTQTPTVTTAWRDGQFAVDPAGVVSRSDIVLGQPNLTPAQSMPLGNGTLGAAVWSGSGFTAQLNRSDTLPGRLSPGQVVIPGLARLTGAGDYSGRVDLYNGQFRESGGGMTANAFVRADKDELVVNVTGADPNTTQTADLKLWAPRTPAASAAGGVGVLDQTWQDTGDAGQGGSGQTYGSLAAITAGGRDVHAQVIDPLTVRVTFRPDPGGSFRVIVAAPAWRGGSPAQAAAGLLGPDAQSSLDQLSRAHRQWWHDYWGHVGLMRLTSADGSAEYMENLRAIDLYTAAAESRGDLPGSQAGVGDLFDSTGDSHFWDPASYWHWNMRMQVGANLGAGAARLNAPYFRLYRDNLSALESWTSAHMAGRPGICVPETMRYNGNGVVESTGLGRAILECDATAPAYANQRTLSTGAEIGMWVWQQYQYTGDRAFLARNYPLMAQAARFLLAYSTMGADGYLHTYPTDAHEQQQDVHDSANDIAGMRALFPATIQAAQMLGTDSALRAQLAAATGHLLPYPRTDAATQTQLLTPAADAAGQDVIGVSYDPAATMHNVENDGLEPVWPYGSIRHDSPLYALAQRTFADRLYKNRNDWSFDPIDAARLGLGSDVEASLIALTEKYQVYPSGLASVFGRYFSSVSAEPYVEQAGVVATALQEALAQDYDGTLRVAPAWPGQWNANGTVYIQGNSKVDVQVNNGTVTTVVIEAGSAGPLKVQNPWLGQQVEVLGSGGTVVTGPTSAATFTIPMQKGGSYLVQRVADPTASLPFAPVTGTAASAYKTLGPVSIGLPSAS